jgi:hypothetical protein
VALPRTPTVGFQLATCMDQEEPFETGTIKGRRSPASTRAVFPSSLRDLGPLLLAYPGLTSLRLAQGRLWAAFCRRFAAAVRLVRFCALCPQVWSQRPPGLKPGSIFDLYAALKRRSSTVLPANEKSPLLAKNARNGAPAAVRYAGDPSLRLKNGCARDDVLSGSASNVKGSGRGRPLYACSLLAQGLRPFGKLRAGSGLHSAAALRLGWGGSFLRALPAGLGGVHPGLKPGSILGLYAALKRRSSTVLPANEKSPLLAKDAGNGAPAAVRYAGDPSLRLEDGCAWDDVLSGSARNVKGSGRGRPLYACRD